MSEAGLKKMRTAFTITMMLTMTKTTTMVLTLILIIRTILRWLTIGPFCLRLLY